MHWTKTAIGITGVALLAFGTPVFAAGLAPVENPSCVDRAGQTGKWYLADAVKQLFKPCRVKNGAWVTGGSAGLNPAAMLALQASGVGGVAAGGGAGLSTAVILGGIALAGGLVVVVASSSSP